MSSRMQLIIFNRQLNKIKIEHYIILMFILNLYSNRVQWHTLIIYVNSNSSLHTVKQCVFIRITRKRICQLTKLSKYLPSKSQVWRNELNFFILTYEILKKYITSADPEWGAPDAPYGRGPMFFIRSRLILYA